MVKALSVLVFCLSISLPAAADPIVTWQATGEIVGAAAFGIEDYPIVPATGTPVNLTLSFDPGTVTATFSSSGTDNCLTVPVSGALTIGGATHHLDGFGFTHAMLPGSNCAPGWPETQFFLGLGEPSVPTPWVIADGFMELWYTDMLVRDAFPDTPNAHVAGFQLRDQWGDWSARAIVTWENNGVQQPTPVPEPGTMALLALGLAAVARRVRRRSVG